VTPNLNALAIFVSVAERLSISVGARRLGISPSGASKAISRLEASLGVRLLRRTTRSLRLTEEGALYFERCHHILAQLNDADNELTLARTMPHGRVTVQMPVGFGRRIVVPRLPEFLQRYPAITVDLELADRIPDLAEERIDLAIRVGDVLDQRAVARTLCRTKFVSCASPEYLRRHGMPKTPDDLADHQCLAYAIPQTGRYREWEFAKTGKRLSTAVSGPLNINNGEALVEMAIAGSGIVTVASFIAAEALAAGSLRVVLQDYMAEGPTVSLMYMPTRYMSARVRALIEFLADLLPPVPPWEAVLAKGNRRRHVSMAN
jgi:LysR family transcriptional regulator for bpeEF and oprC